MVALNSIRSKRDAILEIARRNGAHDLRIFGSVSRGDATESSDLDLLVRFEPGRNLMDQGMLIEELREFLGIKVDVVSEGALSPQDRFSDRVAREAVAL